MYYFRHRVAIFVILYIKSTFLNYLCVEQFVFYKVLSGVILSVNMSFVKYARTCNVVYVIFEIGLLLLNLAYSWRYFGLKSQALIYMFFHATGYFVDLHLNYISIHCLIHTKRALHKLYTCCFIGYFQCNK